MFDQPSGLVLILLRLNGVVQQLLVVLGSSTYFSGRRSVVISYAHLCKQISELESDIYQFLGNVPPV